jgi:selenocysteine lyase/cysteine desulfurase
MERVSARVGRLTGRLLEILSGLAHPAGATAVRIYGPRDTCERGGTVAFNLVDETGRALPYGDVERAAGQSGIALRGGCFCNPGAAEKALELPGDAMRECLESIPQGSFSLGALAECLGGDVPVGALRASVSIPTTDADLDRLQSFLADYVAGLRP